MANATANDFEGRAITGEKQMRLTISEAARRAGVDRKAIYRHLEKGMLSKEITMEGDARIELSELARLYPQAVDATGEASPRHRKTGRDGTDTAQQVIQALRERIAAMEADKARMLAERERDRGERDRLMDLLEAAQRKLTGPVITEPPPRPATPTQPPRGFWARLTGQPA
jgi:hypothetical protein